MNENPYSRIVGLFQTEEAALFFRLGTVSALSPLTVETCGARIGGAQLFCNSFLLPEDQPMELTVSGQKMTGSIRFSQPLKAGDRVVLCSDDDQVFYILCKVVSQ